ncbi:MAG: hypothetical protein H0T93_10380 [Chloroflexia bacterium]|nr:hypothetical protein [Chloroflexia bacterium]
MVSLWMLLLYTVAGTVLNAWLERWYHTGFSAMAALAIAYAVIVLVGVRNGWEDVRVVPRAAIQAVTSLARMNSQARGRPRGLRGIDDPSAS